MDISSSDVVPERRYLRLAIASPGLRRLPTVAVSRDLMRYSADASRVADLGRQEAVRLRHNYIGTEHILLGLISEHNAAVIALEGLRIGPGAIRDQVEEVIGTGLHNAGDGPVSFVTPRSRRVLELSALEAIRAGARQIGAEHVLLGLIREGEGVAAQVLARLGADLNRVRGQLR